MASMFHPWNRLREEIPAGFKSTAGIKIAEEMSKGPRESKATYQTEDGGWSMKYSD